MSSARMYTIVVASGTSERYGSNKLFANIGDETVLERSVRIALQASDGVVVVTDPNTYSNADVHAIVSGGPTRSDSVRLGLKHVPTDVEIIAVHDAARPWATKELYENGKNIINKGNLGAVPAIGVVDTIKKIESDRVSITLDRSLLRAVQTPQVFNAKTLRKAYEGQSQGTDDASLVEALGEHVILFEGTEQNKKITTPADLSRPGLPKGVIRSNWPRVGSGYDIHPFSDDDTKKLILGGVTIEHRGLAGHSDSDALAHAFTDALLSAIGAPDLGTLYPASDPSNKNASSIEFLEKAVLLVHNEGYCLGNASIVINAQEPKLAVHLDDMKKKLSEAMSLISVPETQISITPKHGEGIGEIGQARAIAVYATVLLVPTSN